MPSKAFFIIVRSTNLCRWSVTAAADISYLVLGGLVGLQSIFTDAGEAGKTGKQAEEVESNQARKTFVRIDCSPTVPDSVEFFRC